MNYYDFDRYLKDPTIYSNRFFHHGNWSTTNLYTQNHSLKVSDVFTFGMPRIGNFELAEYIHKVIRTVYISDFSLANFYRITNGKDVIPFLPPQWMEFRHTGDEVCICMNNKE